MERLCKWCGASKSYHGGYGRPIRRNGWFRYECGTRWHPEHGWSRDLSGRCARNIYERALRFIMVTNALDIGAARRVAKRALTDAAAKKA